MFKHNFSLNTETRLLRLKINEMYVVEMVSKELDRAKLNIPLGSFVACQKV